MSGSARSFRSSPVFGSAQAGHSAAAIAVRVHSDERLLPGTVQAAASPSLSAATSSPPLKAFFSVNPTHTISATAIGSENGAVTQQRWHADMLEVKAYLNALDAAREDCANAGLYHLAQLCMQRMEKTIRLLAKRIAKEGNAVAERTRQGLNDRQRLQQLNLRKRWKAKVLAHQQNASTMLAAAEQHHHAELMQAGMCKHEELRSTSADHSIGFSWSSEVQHLQSELQLYVRQHRYREAERVQAQLSRLERQERQAQQRNVTQHHAQRLQAMRVEQAAQLASMKAMHQQEKQEMFHAGRVELDAMIRQHAVSLQAVEERRLFLHESAQAILKSYDNADALDPRATGLKLIRLSQLLWTFPKVQQSNEHGE
ncbi:hypothetical protein NXY56_007761 [Leishmania guyanensis]